MGGGCVVRGCVGRGGLWRECLWREGVWRAGVEGAVWRAGGRGRVCGGFGLASRLPMPVPYMWYQKVTEEAPPGRAVIDESRLACVGWVKGGEGG